LTEPGFDRPVRVAYVIGSLEIGGAETQLVRLINGLDRTRFTPSLMCLFGYGPLRSELDDKVKVESPLLQRPSRTNLGVSARTAIRAVTSLRALLAREKPDIVHGYLMTSYVIAALSTWNTGPGVVIASRRGLDTYPRHSSRWLRLVAGPANRLIDFHLCNSEAVQELVIADENVPRSKTGVIYSGIDPPSVTNQLELPERWSRGGEDGRVAMVANLNSHKRHGDVLDAVSLIVKQRPRFKLVLFGDGAERASIERSLHEKGLTNSVVLAGAQKDAAKFLSGFDLTVLASSKESFPNALLESMVRGIPVVATRVGGIPELVREGIDGILVESGSPEQLAAAMLELLDKPQLRQRMGDAARNRVLNRFSVKGMIIQTEDLYERLVRQVRSRQPAHSAL